MGKRPATIVGLILALAIVLATPVHGATFKAHGKYVGTVVYDGEKVFPDNSVTSVSYTHLKMAAMLTEPVS